MKLCLMSGWIWSTAFENQNREEQKNTEACRKKGMLHYRVMERKFQSVLPCSIDTDSLERTICAIYRNGLSIKAGLPPGVEIVRDDKHCRTCSHKAEPDAIRRPRS